MNKKEKLPSFLRNPLDFQTTNTVLQESILESFKQKAPEEYGDHIVEFSDFEYPKKKTYSLAEQKKALFSRNELSIPLKGTVTLRSRETGQPVDQKRTTLMRVPYLTSRGTYIRGGSEYSLAMQKRLRPGVYTRKTNQDEYETFIKTKSGSGFNIVMDSDTGQLSFKIYNSKTPMYSVMRGLGMSDDEIKETLGEELYDINKVNDYKKAIPKLWKKVTRGLVETDDIERDLAKQFHSMELDETTTRKTLGSPHKNVDNDVFKASIKNLLATYRGERDVDDRDSLSYQQILGPEDIFAEAILKDKARITKQMLYKSQHTKNLDHVHANMYKTIPDYVFNSSRLGMALEEVNPLDAIDANLKITGMGEGGFATEQGVPDTARMVTPTQLSYIDLVRSPESGSVGVDGRLAIDTYKGVDGNLYSKFIDLNGKIKYIPSSDIDDLVIAFPGDIQKVQEGKQPKVRAVNKGKVDYVDPEEVDYSLPSGQQMFSQAANLIPYISGVKGMRALMGCLHPDSMITVTRRGGVVKHTTIEDYSWEHGDLMVSMGSDGTLSWELVRAKVPNYTPQEMYNITLCSGKSLCTTANHKWVTKGKDLGGPVVCVRADELSEGDLIPRYDGTQTNLSKDMVVWDMVDSITEEPPQEVTYDLDLNDKTFVSNNIVVHNSKYTNQALSLPNREAPLVQAMDEQGRSFHERVADQVGVLRPDRPGKVLSITPDEMVVQYNDGETETVELYNDFLLNRKSAYSQTPLIGPGDSFKAGQPLTDSNYTRNGSLALGTNLRVAYMDMKGLNHEDGAIISESAAKKLTSEHLYNEKLDLDKSISTDLGKFLSIFSGTYTRGQLDKLSEEGVIKAGTTVEEGDPLILNMQKRSSKGLGMIQGGKGSQWKNNTITWDHENPGIVTDTWKDDSGIKVAIKSNSPMQIGDKLCFSEDHDLYTINRGWQAVEDIHKGDKLLCLDLNTLELDASEAVEAHRYYHKDAMFIIDNEAVSMKVTMNHKLVVSLDGVHFELVTAKETMQYEVFWLLVGGEMLPVLISVEEDVVIDEHEGWVYCPTLKKHNTLLTRRNGKVHWSGNSGAYGNKGVISKIVPDEEMPKDSQGRPFDYLVNPFGTIGRHNPSQIIEAQLGKVAEVTGKPYILPGFSDEDAMEMVKRELEKNGLSDTETITLPEGREVDGVQTGVGYYMKLHHMSEGKRSEVGEGSFNMTGAPTTELGGAKPKRIGHLEIEAMLAHGAPAVIRDAKLVRGQENREYFKDLMEGKTPKMPKVSLPYRKFIATLQSSGVDITPSEDSESLKLSAMTDSKVESLSSGEITSGDTVHWKANYGKNVRGDANLDPVKGGLFDRGITGGMGGNRYSHITLPVKLPQPVFEKQLRTLLGITEKNMHEVISGKEEFGNYGSGPQAIERALKDVDVEKQIEELSREYKETDKITTKDHLAKKIRALKGLRSQGIKPEDLMTSKALVLPPIFRPVSITSDFEIIADSNLLYKDLLDAKQNYQDMEGVVGEDLRNEALLGVYKAYKAVTGLGTPVKKERVDKNVKGLLSDVFGPSGNKTSVVQRNLTGTPTSYSARGVIIPDPTLTMDEIGLPWDQSWELFKPFVVRRLLRGTDKSPESKKKVLEDIAERRPNANKALMDEMKERPVIYSRAPVLHKYGTLAAYAKPVNGNAIRSNVPTLVGLGADFDGDTFQVHALATPDAVSEAKEKMMPSKSLFSVSDFNLMHTPNHGFAMGLYDLSGRKGRKGTLIDNRVFKNREELMAAYSRGEVDLEDNVMVENE